MNSSAALKSFCGTHGGIVCTSSNAAEVLAWALTHGQRALFFPDQHLGRNTGKALGIPLEQMPLWDPNRPLGCGDARTLRESKVVLWHGFCSVHKRFTVDQIDAARRRFPDVRVIVHPECPMPVVDAADGAGSTDYIARAIASAPPGATFAIGTEINLVQRLANQHPQHRIFCLDSIVCPCSTMYRIHPSYIAWVLEMLERGIAVNRIAVPESVAAPARVALERMLRIKPGSAPQSAIAEPA
jgi:quinolinate synthase